MHAGNCIRVGCVYARNMKYSWGRVKQVGRQLYVQPRPRVKLSRDCTFKATQQDDKDRLGMHLETPCQVGSRSYLMSQRDISGTHNAGQGIKQRTARQT
jgi:hypothetical protein